MKFVKMYLQGGNSYIQPRDEVCNAVDGELDALDEHNEIVLRFTLIDMTEEEYQKLPEFAGH